MLAKKFHYKNKHERDAVASAVKAFHEVGNKIRNIEKRLNKITLNLPREKTVTSLVLKGNQLSKIFSCESIK